MGGEREQDGGERERDNPVLYGSYGFGGDEERGRNVEREGLDMVYGMGSGHVARKESGRRSRETDFDLGGRWRRGRNPEEEVWELGGGRREEGGDGGECEG